MSATRKKPEPSPPRRHPNGANGAHGGARRSGDDAAAPAAAARMPFGFDIETARGVFGSTLGASQGLLGLCSEVQQLNARALADMASSLNEALAQARGARDVQELMQVQLSLASSQMAIAAQVLGATTARLMSAEVQFVEQTQDGAAQLSRHMLQQADADADADDSRGSPHAPAAADTPLAWLGNAQSAWTEMTGRWVELAKTATGGKGAS